MPDSIFREIVAEEGGAVATIGENVVDSVGQALGGAKRIIRSGFVCDDITHHLCILLVCDAEDSVVSGE